MLAGRTLHLETELVAFERAARAALFQPVRYSHGVSFLPPPKNSSPQTELASSVILQLASKHVTDIHIVCRLVSLWNFIITEKWTRILVL